MSDWEIDELVSLADGHWSFRSLGALYGMSADTARRIYQREKKRRLRNDGASPAPLEVC